MRPSAEETCVGRAPAATTEWRPTVAADRVRFQEPEVPSLAETERYFRRAEAAHWFSNGGPNVQAFRARIERYVGGEVHAVPVTNATSALMVALRALAGHPTGSRRLVVVPAYTFVATVDAISWCGFEPAFVDIAPCSWHVEAEAIAAALHRHRGEVAAVLACSTFGTAPSTVEQQQWRDVATAYDVPLLVDSAAGFGAVDDEGRRLGTTGDAEVFSFHATKPFAIGEGGAVTTRSVEVAQRCARLANFGFDAGHQVDELVGLNAKMSELHAAVGLAVFDRYGAVLAARRTRAAEIIRRVQRSGFRPQAGWQGSTFQFVPVTAPSPAVRDAALRLAAERGVELRTYYDTPLHRLAPYRHCERTGPLPVTERLAATTLSLPMANTLGEDAIERIVAVCDDAARSVRTRAA